jgi:hypothetical protein
MGVGHLWWDRFSLIPAGRTARDDGGTVHLVREEPGTGVWGARVVTLGCRGEGHMVSSSISTYSVLTGTGCAVRVGGSWREPLSR